MGQIYNSDAIALSASGGGGGDGALKTVDGIGPDENGNAQLNADSYCGTWQNGTTYRLNNIVSTTGKGGITGLYVCVVESSSADPTDGNDWRRTAGLAGAIDGLVAGVDGNVEYNKTLTPSDGKASPQCNGELSWTVNIDSATTVNLARFTNLSYNTNPAAVIRLVITAADAFDVTFTGSPTYWAGTGSTDVPPVYSVDETQPLTIIEVSLAADGGVVVQQAYPVSASTSPSIPAFEEPGASGFFSVSQADHADPGTTFAAADLIYACASDGSTAVGRLSIAPAAGTWELRGAVLGNGGNATVFVASLFTRIDQVSLAKGDVAGLSAIVRNPAYARRDKRVIRCELFFNDNWHPFSTNAKDSTWWGEKIFQGAENGSFGEVGGFDSGS